MKTIATIEASEITAEVSTAKQINVQMMAAARSKVKLIVTIMNNLSSEEGRSIIEELASGWCEDGTATNDKTKALRTALSRASVRMVELELLDAPLTIKASKVDGVVRFAIEAVKKQVKAAKPEAEPKAEPKPKAEPAIEEATPAPVVEDMDVSIDNIIKLAQLFGLSMKELAAAAAAANTTLSLKA